MSDEQPSMRYVVIASEGGPYDDDHYKAGWEAATVYQMIQGLIPFVVGDVVLDHAVRTGNVPQIDLIAMQYGWRMRAEDMGDGWSQIVFSCHADPSMDMQQLLDE
jgi:hypothetical protein